MLLPYADLLWKPSIVNRMMAVPKIGFT